MCGNNCIIRQFCDVYSTTYDVYDVKIFSCFFRQGYKNIMIKLQFRMHEVNIICVRPWSKHETFRYICTTFCSSYSSVVYLIFTNKICNMTIISHVIYLFVKIKYIRQDIFLMRNYRVAVHVENYGFYWAGLKNCAYLFKRSYLFFFFFLFG